LGLNINHTLSWKTHVDNILPKLCSACFAMRSVKPYVSQQMLQVIYYSYFHSIKTYGIVFWGHSASSVRVFRLQKRIIRSMLGRKSRDSCRKLFINLKILPLPSQYIFLFSCLWLKNKELFTTNNEIHTFCTGQHRNFYQPSANLTKCQTGVFYMGITIYNSLPAYIKNESNSYKKFVSLLKKFLCEELILFLRRILQFSQT
jgi:hypothetical protein